MMNIKITAIAPNNPSSSQIIEKIISFCASGMNPVPVPIALMLWKITSNMSSAIIVMGIAVLMLFVSCPDYKRFILLGLLTIVGAALIVFIIV